MIGSATQAVGAAATRPSQERWRDI